MSTLEDVAKVVAYLSAAYPRFEVRKETVRVYHDILAEFEVDVLQAAAKTAAANGTFFPAAAELRKTALELIARSRGELTADEAWFAVQKAIQRYGSYGETIPVEEGGGWRVPTALDKTTRRAIDAVGGWRAMCLSEQPGIERAHFLRLYDGLQRAERDEAYLLPAVRDVVNRLADVARQPRLVEPGHFAELEY